MLVALFNFSFASLIDTFSFEADFTQSITDDKKQVLTYSGHLVALKPMYAKWEYKKPIKKDVYINSYNVTIVEPELEQVIIKRIESKFDFFTILKSAREIKKNVYAAFYKDIKFIIISNDDTTESISYKDEFDNDVKIVFTNQIKNKKFRRSLFTPNFPLRFDIIGD